VAEAIQDPVLALGRARELAGPNGLVVICGSLYLIAGLRGVLVGRANDLR
jgi:folylpolyglutamate synthase/dihydropteroate synthase